MANILALSLKKTNEFKLQLFYFFIRPLGALNYLHVWHDNSGKGKFASWYLRNVVVRDVQTDQKYIFIANRWFAVEEDDGMVQQ